jgi:hypothetical protein
MRSIVALFITAFAAAQNPPPIERLEKAIADHPNDLNARQSLLRALQSGVPAEKAKPLRRTTILWLIEHHPDSKLFAEPFMQLWPRGRLADPEGYARACELWSQWASAPGASTETIANAAEFFKIPDPTQGVAILDAAERDHPNDPALARARGVLDVALLLGLTGVDDANFATYYTTNSAKRGSASATNARKEIHESTDANLVGAAGEFLSHPNTILAPFSITVGDDDLPTLAEKYLRRAKQLDPGSDTWNAALSNAIRGTIGRINDPSERLKRVREARDLLPDKQKSSMLVLMAQTEFEASDDTDAERDAREMLAPNLGLYSYHLGHTILGQLAFLHGRQAEAKEHLMASVQPPASMKNPNLRPNMALAQEFLDAGDRDTVVQFLGTSRAIYPIDEGRIDHLINFVKRSSMPLDLARMINQQPGFEFRQRPAPDFEVKDPSGKSWTRNQLSGRIVALVFGKGPSVDRLRSEFASKNVVFFENEANREDPVARRFEIESDPTLVVIDRQGRVISYLPGKSNEEAWRRELETSLSGGNLPAPMRIGVPQPKEAAPVDGSKATISWEPLDNAESYVVEWDSRDEGGWVFDREHAVRVIATAETSVVLDLTGLTRVRWRVYGVPKVGPGGSPSAWREIEGPSVTKIYK